MSLKIVIDEKIPFIKGRLEPFAEVVYRDPLKIDADAVKDADAVVVRTRTRCDRQLLEGSSVRLVVTATIGVDHIDCEWCVTNGIKVVNAPGCNAPAVAQYVWASLLRMGIDSSATKVGVIGYGNVGSIVGDWGRRLGAEISVSDPLLEEAGVKLPYKPFERLLAESDVITLHVPLTHSPEPFPTYHLISENELRLMRDGAVLINASRGPVVDGAALLGQVSSGRIRAVIDTWENEPAIDPRLVAKVDVATPHIAGYSLEGKERGTRMALEALDDFFGFRTDKSGLAPAYVMPHTISASDITASYDPMADTHLLRENLARFEDLRGNYRYRSEPDFTSL